MKKIAIFTLTVISLWSCKNNETKPDIPNKMEQVMAVHDEIMPKMGEIGELIGKIQANIDTLQVDSLKLNTIEKLKGANQEMMQWMQDFGDAFEGDEILNGKALTEEKQKLLESFEQSVQSLKVNMEGAIKEAQLLIEN